MVEATDSSAGPEKIHSAPGNAPPTGTADLPSLPSAADLLPPSEREAYRPLSLLALIGFLPAALYALLILVGGLIALFGRSPWLLPNWTFALPILAIFLCWVARAQIQKSEGVLAGRSLTTWGLALSLFFGLTYAAYAGATYVAICEQAKGFARNWLMDIQEGRLQRAFLGTLLPDSRPAENAQLLDRLERNNSPSPDGQPGIFSRFAQMRMVRFIQAGGQNTDVQLLGVGSWSYERGGYRVQLRYRVRTPLTSFEVRVTTQSTPSTKGESGGRGWFIDSKETDMLESTTQEDAEGEELRARLQQGRRIAHQWVKTFQEEGTDHVQSYLQTLPATERQRVADLIRDHAVLGLAGPAPLALPASLSLLKGYRAFLDGDWIQVGPQFWAPAELKKQEMIDTVKKAARRKSQEMGIMLVPNPVPLIKDEGEKGMQLSFDLWFMYSPDPNLPPVLVGGFLILENRSRGTAQEDTWRVKGVELIDGHRASQSRRR